jgi:hypothetical protein
MRPTLGVLAVLSLFATPALAAEAGSGAAELASPAEEERCLPSDLLIAKARTERPSTNILARYTGSESAALVEAMNDLESDADHETPAADEITVLRSAQSDDVLLLGAEEGCLVWRGEISRSGYEHVTWRAFGLPI